MSEPLRYLEAIFPNLAATGYHPKSEKSTVYNCIAYAMPAMKRGNGKVFATPVIIGPERCKGVAIRSKL